MVAKGESGKALAQAAAYLKGNGGLRRALGIADGASLDPIPLGMGEHNQNYLFANPATGQQFVLRINMVRQPFHENQVAYEFGALRALQISGCTPAPLYLDDSASAPGKGAMVIGFCPGKELDFDHLNPGDLKRTAALMADVHAVPVTESCTVYHPVDALRQLYDECADRFRVYRASAYEDARITRWAEKFLRAGQDALDAPCPMQDQAHIINTEPLPSHFLLPENPAERGYFIDWERPIVGEVAQDVAYFTSPTTTFWDSEYLFTREDAQAFVEMYWQAVDGRFPRGSFDARFRAWRMMTALRSVTWCCKALVRYGAQGVDYRTDKTLRKLPIYLSDDFMDMTARACLS